MTANIRPSFHIFFFNITDPKFMQFHLSYSVFNWNSRRSLVGSALARFRDPGQALRQNTKSISSAISSLQISGKHSESKLKLS